MTFPTFGYLNFFDVEIVADSEASGFEKERAIDGFTFDGWKPASAGEHYLSVDIGAAVPADYWAIYSRDMADNGATITVQYSSDNFVGDVNNFDDPFSPSLRMIHMNVLDSVTARYWRFKVESTPASTIIAAHIGTSLTFERDVAVGFSPPSLARKSISTMNRSQNGQLLGLSLRDEGVTMALQFNALTPTWVRANWRSFMRFLEWRSFFFSWRSDERGEDAIYAQIDTERSAMPTYMNETHMQATLQLHGMCNPGTG